MPGAPSWHRSMEKMLETAWSSNCKPWGHAAERHRLLTLTTMGDLDPCHQHGRHCFCLSLAEGTRMDARWATPPHSANPNSVDGAERRWCLRVLLSGGQRLKLRGDGCVAGAANR